MRNVYEKGRAITRRAYAAGARMVISERATPG
jgi:hypothetical protein